MQRLGDTPGVGGPKPVISHRLDAGRKRTVKLNLRRHGQSNTEMYAELAGHEYG